MPGKFCPHCGKVSPVGQVCPCRKAIKKRRPTAGDATRGEREPWRKNYGGAEYRRNRQTAIDRQRGLCADCGKACAEHDGAKWMTARLGGEVDHVRPLCEGGTNAAENLVLRCKSCHGKVEARRRLARRRKAEGNPF